MTEPVADQVLAILDRGGIEAASIGGVLDHTTSRRALHKTREAMLTGRRYFLDEETSATAAEYGRKHPELLLATLPRCRLPHAKMLIDYDNRAAISALGQVPLDDAPERTAVYIERLHAIQPSYRLSAVMAHPEFAGLSLLSIEYDLENQPRITSDMAFVRSCWFDQVRQTGAIGHLQGTTAYLPGSDLSRDQLDLIWHTLVLGSVQAETRFPEGSPLDDVLEAVDSYQAEKYFDDVRLNLASHAHWTLNPLTSSAVRTRVKSLPILLKTIGGEPNEFAGMWRIIMGALALMNEQDFVSESVYKADTTRRWTGRNFLPYLEHRRVSLKLPRKVTLRRAVITFGEGIPKRRHEVSGHWRHRHGLSDAHTKHKDCCPDGERHVFITDYHSSEGPLVWRQHCELCGYQRWWVNEFERGDASLGYVTKDRIVTMR